MTSTTTLRPVGRLRRMSSLRRISLAGGLLYLITFIASLPALKLYADVVNQNDYISTAGSNTPLLWGAWLEIITAIAGIGTAVVLYPVTKRVSATAAIGFVTSRVVEAALIGVGVVSLLAIVTLRHEFAASTGAQRDALEVTGRALVAVRQWTFLVGPGLIAGVNGLFLGYVMYRSRLVPRIIPTIGLIGAPLILVSATATIFGVWDQLSVAGAVFGFPVAAWELSLGMWLTFKGFRPTTLTLDTVVAPDTFGSVIDSAPEAIAIG
ncbi:uncharacterized protein DUF4386 [Jatrophihabitans sp. GAS493]|uniref:DUF4386 domain-containing protein n=1 Tax=Jatrophihabitans sp. GAS493 TaxID=1907575 RepID=UPI000BBF74A9|nr:DUF4386 domain-containing protein [Jatrophihabitans sp. GAS493]SOD74890.1 uncharacterized protein DUF4386 [Jatrophihabitans sp. GAS493]